jgi:hypothetical protein
MVPRSRDEVNRDYFVIAYVYEDGQRHLAVYPISEAKYRAREAAVMESRTPWVPKFDCPLGPRPFLAPGGGWRTGRACPLCPGISDINLFRYCQGVIDLNAEVSDRVFDFGMPSNFAAKA